MALPAYCGMEERSPQRFAYASGLFFSLYTVTLFAIALCGILLAGRFQLIDFNRTLSKIDGSNASIFAQAVFASILIQMTTHYFYTCKQCSLTMLEEIKTKSMSQKLDARLAQCRREQEAEQAL